MLPTNAFARKTISSPDVGFNRCSLRGFLGKFWCPYKGWLESSREFWDGQMFRHFDKWSTWRHWKEHPIHWFLYPCQHLVYKSQDSSKELESLFIDFQAVLTSSAVKKPRTILPGRWTVCSEFWSRWSRDVYGLKWLQQEPCMRGLDILFWRWEAEV